MKPQKKKLIEVALPLDAINRSAASEKLIHVGTTSNIHAWWARRPLAACRAVIFASLVDDPGEYLPEPAAQKKRAELFALLERLVSWEANNDDAVLHAARAEIEKSCNGKPPTVVDPFCGSGSIPIEALRLGLDSIGCDLNPIAVAISKALVEVPAVVTGHDPLSRKSSGRLLGVGGFDGFKEDLATYCSRVLDKARGRVGDLYAESFAGRTPPIAWLWCRTAECPNPGCNTRVPLIKSYWLSKTPKSSAYLRIGGSDHSTGRVSFEVTTGRNGQPTTATVSDAGASCPVCDTPLPFAALREQGRLGKLGFQMNAYVTKNGSQMEFDAATSEEEEKALKVRAAWVPDTMLPEAALGFRVQSYGLTRHSDLFLPRQLVS
jgi:putative DNA methylase